MKYILGWHDNGGNEFFRIKDEGWLTLKSGSDSLQSHNFMLLGESDAGSTGVVSVDSKVLCAGFNAICDEKKKRKINIYHCAIKRRMI